ncbi:MAG: R3H domain-containing nucleic acid-binding protein [Candidatus Moraniibacteriota bacterium]
MDKIQIIEEESKRILEKIGFPGDIHIETIGDGYLVKITVQEGSKLLIGQHGVALSALQYIMRSLVTKKLAERLEILVDVNGYWEEKKPLLEREALAAEEEVCRTGRPVALRPMLPYERKIIHTFLVSRNKVATESAGHGEDRKVIVKALSDM